MRGKILLVMMILMLALAACAGGDSYEDTPTVESADATATAVVEAGSAGGTPVPTSTPISDVGELANVVRVIDGDTIVVEMRGVEYTVRYIGINTPEMPGGSEVVGEACAPEATEANRQLVGGKQVWLVKDVSETDQYDRLLRYVYVGDLFVNAELVRVGWAEAVLYEPDDREYQTFLTLEHEAAATGTGCHAHGIFDDGSYTR